MRNLKILCFVTVIIFSGCVFQNTAQHQGRNFIGKVYIANSGSDSVSVIDVKTNKMIKAIPVGEKPVDIAFSPDSLFLLVRNENSHNLSLVDTDIDSVIENVSLAPDIFLKNITFIDTTRIVAFSRGKIKKKALDGNYRYQVVTFIISLNLRNPENLDTLAYLHNIAQITNVLISPDKNYLAITGYLDQITTDYEPSMIPVTLIDVRRREVITRATIDVKNAVFSPDSKIIYAKTSMPSGFYKWDINSQKGKFWEDSKLKSSGKMIISPDGKYIYQTFDGEPSLLKIDLITKKATAFNLPYPSQALSILAGEGKLYCIHQYHNLCTVFDIRKEVVIKKINVKEEPSAIIIKNRR